MKTKRFFIPVVSLLIGFLLFNACKKDINPIYPVAKPVVTTIPVGIYPAGLGSTPGTPVCNPFILPENIEVIGEIKSAAFKSTVFDKETQNINDFIYTPKTTFVELGSGSLVQIYMKFYNKNSQPTTLVIPGGLMFLPGDTAAQTGTTTQNDTIIIPPHDSLGCHIKTYCTNLHKHVPNNTSYKMLGTTVHSDLWTMVNILKTKKKLAPGSQVQSIIWNITDRGGLTDADRTYLNNLP
ncbi:MAG: hypothetical protein ACOYO1_06035 [Bacteroidales bacterium]